MANPVGLPEFSSVRFCNLLLRTTNQTKPPQTNRENLEPEPAELVPQGSVLGLSRFEPVNLSLDWKILCELITIINQDKWLVLVSYDLILDSDQPSL